MDLLGFREKHTQQVVGHCRGQGLWPWNLTMVWLVFSSWVNSYANEWEDHPSHWGTTHSSLFYLVPWRCPATSGCVSWFIDWGLRFTWIWLVILDPIDFNWLTLYPCAMSFFQSLCSALFPPVSCSFPEPHPDTQGLYNLLERQPENSWPCEENTL